MDLRHQVVLHLVKTDGRRHVRDWRAGSGPRVAHIPWQVGNKHGGRAPYARRSISTRAAPKRRLGEISCPDHRMWGRWGDNPIILAWAISPSGSTHHCSIYHTDGDGPPCTRARPQAPSLIFLQYYTAADSDAYFATHSS